MQTTSSVFDFDYRDRSTPYELGQVGFFATVAKVKTISCRCGVADMDFAAPPAVVRAVA